MQKLGYCIIMPFSIQVTCPCRDWLAYPHFRPPERFQPFKLADGLYLNNAWENAASAMEMSAVAAKNCALLIAKYLSKVHSCSSSNPSASMAFLEES